MHRVVVPAGDGVVAVLRDVAAAARFDLVKDAGLSANVVLAQIRSTIVDLMQVAGMERVAAIATPLAARARWPRTPWAPASPEAQTLAAARSDALGLVA